MEVPCSSTCGWCTDTLMNNPFTVQKSGGFHHQQTHQDSHRPQSSQLSCRCRGLWSRVGISLHRGRVQWCRGVLLGELGIWGQIFTVRRIANKSKMWAVFFFGNESSTRSNDGAIFTLLRYLCTRWCCCCPFVVVVVVVVVLAVVAAPGWIFYVKHLCI